MTGAHASDLVEHLKRRQLVMFVFSEVDRDNFELHGLQKFSSLNAQVLMTF